MSYLKPKQYTILNFKRMKIITNSKQRYDYTYEPKKSITWEKYQRKIFHKVTLETRHTHIKKTIRPSNHKNKISDGVF